jgi:hypothetical protein
MPPKIQPVKKRHAKLKASAENPNHAAYMRVARGQAFPMGKPGHVKEISKLKSKHSEYVESSKRLAGMGGGTSHMHKQRAIHINNRIQLLEESRMRYIREGTYVYPARNPAHGWMHE